MDQLLRESIREWMLKVLLPFLREEAQDRVDDVNLAIISADTDKIKDYVFESPKLPEIRGASILLDNLNQGDLRHDYQLGDPRMPQNLREILKHLGLPIESVDDPKSPGCIAFAGGGSLMALVPLELNGIRLAEELCEDIEALYPEETGKVTITCINEPWKAGMTPREAIERAITALRCAKEEKAAVPFFESPPFVRRCDSCRLRPAVRFESDPDGGEVARCRVCLDKLNIGRNEKSRWHKKFEEEYVVSAERAIDLNDIAEFSKGYVGFVYADGNGLGDWVNAVDKFDEYSRRSRAVHESVSKAVYNAIHRNLGPIFDQKFEIVTIGGDDAIIIVPARWALAITRDICREFCGQMNERGYPGRTMSAGVVISDSHTPVYFLRRTAESLLKNAKINVENEGTVDFLVLKNQSMLATDIAHLRSTKPWSFTDPVDRTRLNLSHGPYSISELDQLLRLVCQGRKFGVPRSQLHALNQDLKRGRFASNLHFQYHKARGREATQKFMGAFQELFCKRPAEDIPPWQKMTDRRGRNQYRTTWSDMVEIWDFAQEGSNAHTD